MFYYIFLLIYGLILGTKLQSSEGADNEKVVNQVQLTDIDLLQTDLAGEKSDSNKNNIDTKLIINETVDSVTAPVENQADGDVIYGSSENRDLVNDTVSVSNSINRELSNSSGGVHSNIGQLFDATLSDLTGLKMEGSANKTKIGNHYTSHNTNISDTFEDRDRTENTLICQLWSAVSDLGIKVSVPTECNNMSTSQQNSGRDSGKNGTVTDKWILVNESQNLSNNSNNTPDGQISDAETESEEETKIYLDTFVKQYIQELLECTFSNMDISKLIDLPEKAIDIIQMDSD